MSPPSFREILGNADSPASLNDSTLIIIDAQYEYAEGKLKVAGLDESRTAIAALLQRFRKTGGQVIHVIQVVPDGAPVFTPTTKLAAEFEELSPVAGEIIIQKKHPSSFADTEMHKCLQELGSSRVILTGYMAHVCVSSTARDASQLGYNVVIARDCVGDRDIPGASASCITQMVMHELSDAFALVVDSTSIV